MNKKTDTRTMLLTASPMQLMFSLSLPAIIGMVVVGLYSLMDSVFVGQMVGASAMGAVAISYPFTLIGSGIAALIGMGSASVLSRAVGKRDQDTIDRIMGNLIAMNLIVSVILTVVGIVFARRFLILSGSNGQMLDMAVHYLRIIFAGTLFVNFAQSANMLMRGEGILKKAMLISGSGAVLNIILDPIFISLMGKSGAGIEGAAYATILSQFITAGITLWYFLKKSQVVKIHGVRLERSLLSPILSIGVSAMLMQIMTLVQQTVIYNVAAQYGGDTWQIILGASLRIQLFAFVPLWGMSQGFQPAAGTNYGAGDYARVKKLALCFSLSATVFSLIFYIPIEFAPRLILSWFITDPVILAQGAGDLRILFGTYIMLGSTIMAITMFQAFGRAAKAGILAILRPIVLFIPLVLLLPRMWNLGIHGVFLAVALTDGIVFVISMILMFSELRNLSDKAVPFHEPGKQAAVE